MKRITLSLTMFIIVFCFGLSRFSVKAYKQADNYLLGTSYPNNIINSEYLNDIKLEIKMVSSVNNSLKMDFHFLTDNFEKIYNMEFLVYQNEKSLYLKAKENEAISFATFYIEFDANPNLVLKQNKTYNNISRIAVSIENNLYYFENNANYVLKLISDIDAAETEDISIISMSEWFINYVDHKSFKNNTTEQMLFDKSLMTSCNINPQFCFDDGGIGDGGGDGGSNEPIYRGTVPQYLKNNYFIFLNEGSDIYKFNDILVYKYTVRSPFSYSPYYYTYTLSINVMYDYPRRNEDSPGEARLTLRVREYGKYCYYSDTNELFTENNSSYLTVEDVTITMEMISDEIAFKHSKYYGNASKPFLTSSDLQYLVKYIPYIGDELDTILNIRKQKGSNNMDVDYFLPCFSTYSEQELNYEICNHIFSNSNNYYLKEAGDYFTLYGELTNMEQIEGNNIIRYYFNLSIEANPFIGLTLPKETYSESRRRTV